jgi:1,4-alpha-glucan branching enzyme
MSSPTPLDTQPILALDGYLSPFIPAIQRRYEKFRQWKDSIEIHEGGYDTFSQGYRRFGIHVQPSGEIVYREWAPNAKQAFLIGDFSE